MPVLHINDECVPCSGILFDKDGTLLDLLATWELGGACAARTGRSTSDHGSGIYCRAQQGAGYAT